jgi:hypothetical protein
MERTSTHDFIRLVGTQSSRQVASDEAKIIPVTSSTVAGGKEDRTGGRTEGNEYGSMVAIGSFEHKVVILSLKKLRNDFVISAIDSKVGRD